RPVKESSQVPGVRFLGTGYPPGENESRCTGCLADGRGGDRTELFMNECVVESSRVRGVS
ncbi:MAG: hypothetical protein LUQ69_08540, partial [Methanoregulaceae archaeon]|nr:hypothetical protein [Methanoregulaceae archaeon]